MRTNIDIDDKLMASAMKAGGFVTKKETVEEGLRLLAKQQAYEDLKALRGAVRWEGNLHEMRQDRFAYNVTTKLKAKVKANVQASKADKTSKTKPVAHKKTA